MAIGDGYTNLPHAFDIYGQAELRGRFDHARVEDGSYAELRNVVISGSEPCSRAPASGPGRASAAPEPKDSERRSIVAFDANSKSCPCGFEAFRWQTQCPRCRRTPRFSAAGKDRDRLSLDARRGADRRRVTGAREGGGRERVRLEAAVRVRPPRPY
jgi:hypothetical protein